MSGAVNWLAWVCKVSPRRRARGTTFGGSCVELFETRELLSAHVASVGKQGKVKASAKEIPDYSGHWETSEGPMDITQNGKNITAVVTPPTVGEVNATAKVTGKGSLKGKVIFDLEGTKTIVKYTAKLLANDPNKMEGTYNLTFVGITKYSWDFTADRTISES